MEIKSKKVGKNLNVFIGEELKVVQSPSKELIAEINSTIEKYAKLKSKTTVTAVKLADKIKELASPIATEEKKVAEKKKTEVVAKKKAVKKEIKKEVAKAKEANGVKSTMDMINELKAKDTLSNEEISALQELLAKYKKEKEAQAPAQSGHHGRREY